MQLSQKRKFRFPEGLRGIQNAILLANELEKSSVEINSTSAFERLKSSLIAHAKLELNQPLFPVEQLGITLIKLQSALFEKKSTGYFTFGNWALVPVGIPTNGTCKLEFARFGESNVLLGGSFTFDQNGECDDIEFQLNVPELQRYAKYRQIYDTSFESFGAYSAISGNAFEPVVLEPFKVSASEVELISINVALHQLFLEVHDFGFN